MREYNGERKKQSKCREWHKQSKQGQLFKIKGQFYDKRKQISVLSIVFWRRQWHPTPVPLPGKSHGRTSLVGGSPWGRTELDTTERLHFHFSLSCIGEGNGTPTSVFLPGESQGWGSLVGCCLWGHTESDTNEVTQQQQHCVLGRTGR